MLNTYPHATKELIVENHSAEIFRYYFRNFELGKLYSSPLRKDPIPSFNIYASRKNQSILLFKDFGGQRGNAIDFVMALQNVAFYDAITTIVKDLNLPYKTRGNYVNIVPVFKRKDFIPDEKVKHRLLPIIYKFNGRPIYTETDRKFWLRDLKVPSLSYLTRHRILSAKELHIGGASVWYATTDSPIYIYPEKYEGEWWRKAYRPFGEPGEKWRSDYPDAANMIHGVDLLRGNTEDLIITKSVKDNVVLDCTGFEAIATQGEDMPFNPNLMLALKKWYKRIYVLFDNDYTKEDNVGRRLSEKFANEHDVGQIIIPRSYEFTDTSELIATFDHDTLKRLINKWKT